MAPEAPFGGKLTITHSVKRRWSEIGERKQKKEQRRRQKR
jgi:hypothetical protein